MDDFEFWFLVLCVTFIIILYGYLQLSDKSDSVNNFLAFFALSFVFFNILILLSLMNQISQYEVTIFPLFVMTLGLPVLIIWLIVSVTTLLAALYKLMFKSKDFTKLQEKMNVRMDTMSKAKRDTYRKISHVLIFIGFFIIWNVSYTMVSSSEEDWVEMLPSIHNTLDFYIKSLTQPYYLYPELLNLGWFYFLLFFFFFMLCLILLANELTRKMEHVYFPFNLFPNLIMTEEEKRSYGTYLYFAIGQLFAAFLCPPMVFLAILGMAGIADLMTSQIGIRFGKHRIKWNNKKTWEGAIAGTITCVVLCFFFVGIVWAIIFAIVFTIIDLATNKPINASDNLLIPIGCALVYVLLVFFFDLNYYTIIMQAI